MTHILLVEPNEEPRKRLCANLQRNGFTVQEADDLQAIKDVDLGLVDTVIANVHLPSGQGIDLIRIVGETPLILVAECPSVPAAVEAIQVGAVDYLGRPFEPDVVIAAVERAISRRRKPRPATHGRAKKSWPMLGKSPLMLELFDRIVKVAPTDSSILVQGESGTGKELVARSLHACSNRRHAPMMALNCAAIPDSLIDSELFGHEHGPFSTDTGRRGLVEAADAGTLFLDEVADLPLETQARLLRLLQDGEIRKFGATQTQQVDVRIITATHRDLHQLTENGQFRDDLFYRLNVVTLTVPPLRERGDDVIVLAEALLDKKARKLNRLGISLSPAAMSAIRAYQWPGNVRELENAIERAVILCDSASIDPDLLALDLAKPAPTRASDDDAHGKVSLEDYFVRFVTDNQDQLTETELAQQLGISRKSLWERRQRLNIPRRGTRKRGPRRNT